MDTSDRRALRARAANAVDHTKSLWSQDPAWGSEVRALAGGWLVLAGRGLYVNRAIGAGTATDVTSNDLDLLLARSEVVGVEPAIEVTRFTSPESIRLIRARGFAHDSDSDIALLTRSVATTTTRTPTRFVISPVESEADLRIWQETSAAGWGHASTDARRASDAFAAAACAVDNEHMVIAFDLIDGQPVGCASMTVWEGVAMLGGMSTIPSRRKRGVQAALLHYRLAMAHRMGCDLAATTAARGGASERNLQRHGFDPRITIQRFVLS